MAKVILHIGDKVTHKTLGEGVVTIVDDEYVTIKFATDELTFRLPDAFRNGFLTSDAAIIKGDLDDDYDDDEEEDDDDDDYGDEDDEDEEDDDEGEDGEEYEDNVDDKTIVEDEPRLGFFSKLMLGIAGAHAIDMAERHIKERKREREQQWHDSIFWQEAARRKNPFNDDDNHDDW